MCTIFHYTYMFAFFYLRLLPTASIYGIYLYIHFLTASTWYSITVFILLWNRSNSYVIYFLNRLCILLPTKVVRKIDILWQWALYFYKSKLQQIRFKTRCKCEKLSLRYLRVLFIQLLNCALNFRGLVKKALFTSYKLHLSRIKIKISNIQHDWVGHLVRANSLVLPCNFHIYHFTFTHTRARVWVWVCVRVRACFFVTPHLSSPILHLLFLNTGKSKPITDICRCFSNGKRNTPLSQIVYYLLNLSLTNMKYNIRSKILHTSAKGRFISFLKVVVSTLILKLLFSNTEKKREIHGVNIYNV